MTNQRIIYQTPEGGTAIIIPVAGFAMTVAQRAATFDLTPLEYAEREYAAGVTPQQFNAGLAMTVAEIAAKDVPTGLPYKIVDVAEIPTDRTSRDFWTVNAADLNDGAGA